MEKCPFCGGDRFNYTFSPNFATVSTHCEKCGAEGPAVDFHSTRAEECYNAADEAWNNRFE